MSQEGCQCNIPRRTIYGEQARFARVLHVEPGIEYGDYANKCNVHKYFTYSPAQSRSRKCPHDLREVTKGSRVARRGQKWSSFPLSLFGQWKNLLPNDRKSGFPPGAIAEISWNFKQPRGSLVRITRCTLAAWPAFRF